ncbi:MAG: hypothetical protein Q4E37_04660 [Tissierellia bacterium]|nr:hypothetical protein [Tissierellia bacterium]
MTLGDLSVLYIYFLYGLIFLLAMGGFSLGQRSKLILKTRSYEAMAYGIFLLSLVLLTVLTEILNRNKVSYLRLKDLSIFPFLGLVFLVLVFDGVLFRKLKASSKEDFTDLSIKECLDTLPVGVAFSDCQGRPYLVNYKIDELSRLVFGRNLVNSLDFFDEAMVQNFMEGPSS